MASFNEFIGKTAAGDKTGSYSLFAGLHCQRGCQMGFARAAFSEKNDISILSNIFSTGQFMDEASIEIRCSIKVEDLKGFQ